ncbi:uncharacterized protein LOC112345083 [Selaginella moellendorffii]|uniref:uncharacterized protein LOC112345083 n=1 Tax=Selaginella moellendorffii TaxID=88036 RepID=UPI000D1CC0F0|nr:uncharacterized protein LOC112345083 [Selaginella moellendorffii]|eukprot:XP_024526844.1 uncharacterized protein LOC112345083 [Selaginella moellendorffii]
MEETMRGWPLGLQPVNVRVHLAESWLEHAAASSAAAAASSLSPSLSFSSSLSSDLDTQSTVSLLPETGVAGMTLGSLIGIRSAGRRREQARHGRGGMVWALLGCRSNGNSSDETGSNATLLADSVAPPSLGEILALERSSRNGGGGGEERQVCVNVMYEEHGLEQQEQQQQQEGEAVKVDACLYQPTSSALSTMCGCLVVVTGE